MGEEEGEEEGDGLAVQSGEEDGELKVEVEGELHFTRLFGPCMEVE